MGFVFLLSNGYFFCEKKMASSHAQVRLAAAMIVSATIAMTASVLLNPEGTHAPSQTHSHLHTHIHT